MEHRQDEGGDTAPLPCSTRASAQLQAVLETGPGQVDPCFTHVGCSRTLLFRYCFCQGAHGKAFPPPHAHRAKSKSIGLDFGMSVAPHLLACSDVHLLLLDLHLRVTEQQWFAGQ